MNTTLFVDKPRRTLFIRNLLTIFLHRRALAVGLVFASDSILMGSWVAHIPYVKNKLQLSDGDLGLLLFALPLGLILVNPVTGWIIARIGEARACLWSAVGLALSICIPINAPNAGVMAVGLFLMGVHAALINVAMNTSATNLERSERITIMSACHGMWSLGGLLGSGLAGAVIALHISPQTHMVAVAVLVLVLTVLLQPVLEKIPSSSRPTNGRPTNGQLASGQIETVEKAGSSFVRPNRDLLLMILIGLAVAMGEGVALDWSAVYLRQTVGASSQIAALGFASFSLTMTGFRFFGDMIIPRIGGKRWLLLGGILGALGLFVAIGFPYPATALAGFALLGAGCSLGAPILYSASMRIPGIPPAAGLATFATFSFVGFLAGPPLIGFVAEAFGLYYGLGFVATLLLLSAGLARIVKLF